ncbi:Protein trichome birefringence-like 25 [Asimina triloba]
MPNSCSIYYNHIDMLIRRVTEVVEVYHDKEYRSKRWQFPSYNFTLSVVWSPFLIKAAIFEDMNGVSSSEIQLYLDILEETWTKQYENFDILVISGGKWFLKTAIYWENDTVAGCHYCPGKNLTELGFEYAYRKALQLVFNFMTRSDHKALIMFRAVTPDHFENGEWFSGGTCNRTVPFRDGEIDLSDVDKVMRDIELGEFEKAASAGQEKGLKMKLLDTTQLALMRPDGHPGPYRQFHPFAKDKNAKVQNDCLHWCLPGPIDNWNDLVMEMCARIITSHHTVKEFSVRIVAVDITGGGMEWNGMAGEHQKENSQEKEFSVFLGRLCFGRWGVSERRGAFGFGEEMSALSTGFGEFAIGFRRARKVWTVDEKVILGFVWHDVKKGPDDMRPASYGPP